METVREEDDETEEPMYVFERCDRGKGVREKLLSAADQERG